MCVNRKLVVSTGLSWAFSQARHLDIILFLAGGVYKGRCLACTMGLSNRWANSSNLLFLAIVALVGCLFPRRLRLGVLCGLSVLASILLFGDAVHYRAFSEVIGIRELHYAVQLRDVHASIATYTSLNDILYFVDLPLWGMLILVGVFRTESIPRANPNRWALSGCLTVSLVAYATGVHHYVKTTKPYFGDNFLQSQLVVLRQGVLNYHAFDLAGYVKEKLSTRRIRPQEISQLFRWFREHQETKPMAPYFGAAKGRNVVFVQVESLEAFVIGLRVSNQEVTPYLNCLCTNSIYFSRFYSQAGWGRTSDAEFCALNSLMPPREGAAVFEFAGNSYHGLPAILGQRGYATFAMHTSAPSFWNIRNMHVRYGFQKGYYRDAYLDPGKVGDGNIQDDVFFARSLPIVKTFPQPFFVHMLTMSSHSPFNEFPRGRKELSLGRLEGTIMGDYLDAVHFVDSELRNFTEGLKAEGLYERCMLVIYGDHGAVPPDERKRLDEFETDREGLQADLAHRDRVPLFLIVPGMVPPKRVESLAGQVDIAPTVLYLLGITNCEAFLLGDNLVARKGEEVVYFSDGMFLTSKGGGISSCRSQIARSGISVSGGQPTKPPGDIAQMVVERLHISDTVMAGNLIPKFCDILLGEGSNRGQDGTVGNMK
jgi:lipoteichoic acid synthase